MSDILVLNRVSEPYAEALFSLAQSKGLIGTTTKDLELIGPFFEESYGLKKLLEGPFLSRESKKKIIMNIFGEKICDTTLNFLFVLVDRNRINLLKTIVLKYAKFDMREKSIIEVKVTSVIEFAPKYRVMLWDQINSCEEDVFIQFDWQIDPNLLGGFTIEMQSRLVDVSIRGKLNKLKAHLQY
jgi:F-type H+-transporting ATPase subunit delta